ncbi:MAG: hypothetical protein LBN27_07830 [Prevotellaceae bacterium]|jgi:hypothetical protein|nr:hypothetical protein [Prevotellaceae bacterium]
MKNRSIKAISAPGTASIAVVVGLLVLLFAFSPEFSILSAVNIVAAAFLVFLLFRCNEKLSFIRVRTVLHGSLFVFLLLTSRVSSDLWNAFFLLLAVWRLMAAYGDRDPVSNVFDAFLLLAAGSFFTPEMLLLAPVFWLSFPFIRISGLRAFLASIIGLTTAYIVGLSLLFALGALPDFWLSVRAQMLVSVSLPDLHHIIYIAFLFLFYIIAFFGFLSKISADKIRVKQLLYFLFFLTFFLFIITFFQPFNSVFPLLSLLLGIVLGHYFTLSESRFSLIVFFAFLIGGVVFFFLMEG